MINKSRFISQVDITQDGTLMILAKVNNQTVFYELDQDTLFTILELQEDKTQDRHSTDSRSPNYVGE